MNMQKKLTLAISCPNQKGIVSRISTAIFEADGNILEADQYDDANTGNFFMRTVLEIGEEVGRLTRVGGLRLMLSAMRAPAAAAGLGSLQHFLETGFDAFKSLTPHDSGPKDFLEIIHRRETHLMALLFDGDDGAIRAALQMD